MFSSCQNHRQLQVISNSECFVCTIISHENVFAVLNPKIHYDIVIILEMFEPAKFKIKLSEFERSMSF